MVESFSRSINSELNKTKEDVLINQKMLDNEFIEVIYNIWGDSLNSLEELIILQSDTIDVFTQKYEDNTDDTVIYSLLNIYARSNQIAKEILLLLKNSYGWASNVLSLNKRLTFEDMEVILDF